VFLFPLLLFCKTDTKTTSYPPLKKESTKFILKIKPKPIQVQQRKQTAALLKNTVLAFFSKSYTTKTNINCITVISFPPPLIKTIWLWTTYDDEIF